MATNVSPLIEPDVAVMTAFLEMIFAPLREDYEKGLLELRFGESFTSSYFNIRPDGIEEAARFAANRNREGSNVYVGVNPRPQGLHKKGAAEDKDIEISRWQFADFDDADAVAAVGQKIKALPPFFTVTTGTEPHRRPHFYWLLDEPVRNMEPWRERQRGIVQSLDGDRTIVNPSRIMRIAGSVNYPPPHKLKRGYRVELTTMRTTFSSEREPMRPEEVAKAYPAQVDHAEQRTVQPENGQTTLSAMRGLRAEDLINACAAGVDWHHNMVRLTSHLTAKGRATAEILAMAPTITLPGWTVQQTIDDMKGAVRSARQKWAISEPVDTIEEEEAKREPSDSVFELLDMDELEAMPPPTWLVHEMIADHGLSVVYGEPGAGKSFITLDMALRLAFGMDWHGVATRPAAVLYIAGEGARGLGKRVKGWRREHGLEGVEAPFLLLPVAVQLLDEKERAKLIRTIDAAIARSGFNIGLTVIDTVSRALAGQDENGQEAMSMFVGACAEIQEHMKGAVIGVHHSGKDKERGMRGSTVLLGGCDASIRIEKSDERVTIKTEKQKDAEQAEPIHMTLKKVSWAQGLEEEQSTLVPIKSEPSLFRDSDGMTAEKIEKAFDIVQENWADGNPLSMFTAAKSAGKYAPSVISSIIEVPSKTVERYLIGWQENGQMETVRRTNGKEKSGLKVNRRLNNGS